MTLALNHSKSEGTAKLILIGIANHDGDGGSWPSVGTLARYANVTERTVQRHIATLVELGEIERIMNDGGTHRTPGHMRPNLYKILLKCPSNCDGTTQHRVVETPPDTDVTPRHQRHLPPDTSVTPPLTPVSPLPLTPVSPEPSLEPSIEPSSNPPQQVPTSPAEEFVEYLKSLGAVTLAPGQPQWLTAEGFDYARNMAALHGFDHLEAIARYEQAVKAGWSGQEEPNDERFTKTWLMHERVHMSEGRPLPGADITVDSLETLKETFERFWAVYPKQQNQNEAIEAYKIAAKKVNPATLISKAQGYARMVKHDHTEWQFVKYAHNWLAEERWNDSYPTGLPSRSHTAADD